MNYVLLGAILSGSVIGAIPAIVGATKGKLGLGLGGFAACLIGSILLGMILSIPLCAIFIYLILKKPQDNSQNPSQEFNSDKTEVYEQIKKLSDLKETGILSEAEFQAKKEELLKRI